MKMVFQYTKKKAFCFGSRVSSIEDTRRLSKSNTKDVSWFTFAKDKFIPQLWLRKLLRNRTDIIGSSRKDSFHASMKVTLVVGQLFGLMPVSKVTSPNPDSLRYNAFSWRFLYCLLTFVVQAILTALCARRLYRNGLTLTNSSNVVFYTSTLLTTLTFLSLARRWPALVARVRRLETPRRPRRRATPRCTLACYVVLAFAAVEHFLSIVFGLRVARICNPEMNLAESYFKYAIPWVFDYTTYSHWKGALGEFYNLQSTFNWNYNDIFIITVSIYLTTHYDELHQRILKVRSKHVEESFWRTARCDYARLAHLVRLIDANISSLVMLSFFCNLYFICLQLFNSLKRIDGAIHTAYFTYSFSFLVARSLAVSLLAARVHSAARAPAVALYDVPASAFCLEVQRFLEQINNDAVALSGLQFFFVTRKLILSVVGTIVTYELVLLQFSETADLDASISSKPIACNNTDG